MDVFSSILSKTDLPESLWLPPEVRSALEGERSLSPPTPRATLLRLQLGALKERVEHVDSLITKLNIDSRLLRLEQLSSRQIDAVSERIESRDAQLYENADRQMTSKKTHRGG